MITLMRFYKKTNLMVINSILKYHTVVFFNLKFLKIIKFIKSLFDGNF